MDSKLKTKLTAETEIKHTVAIVGYFSVMTVVKLMISVVCGTVYMEHCSYFSVVTVMRLLNSVVCGYQCYYTCGILQVRF